MESKLKMVQFEINKRKIGQGHPVYIIAELSANHGQNFDEAVRLINAAKEAGADAIKIQTYTADTMTIKSSAKHFLITGDVIWKGRTLYDLYAEAHTPWDWQPRLKKIANDLGMDFFSSPFDSTAVDFLEKMEVPAYKIASFEVVDFPLLRKVAATGKPVIMSTGMADLSEIDEAVKILRDAGCKQMALLKCTSAYPAPPEEMNLKTISHLGEAFQAVPGLSDHTLGSAVAVAAVALGARIIEKHFTISRSVQGPDSSFSMEPSEFKEMVGAIRVVEKALGNIYYGVSEKESKSRVFRRSLFVVKEVKAGQKFTFENVRSIRPGNGLHTRYLDEILGRTAVQDVPPGTPLSWDLVGGQR